MKSMVRMHGLRIATLALCTAVIGVAPMVAQDNSAAGTQQQQDGPRRGGFGGSGGRGQMGERRLEMMTQELNLSAEQVTQIKAIEMDARKQSMALREDTSVTRDQMREKQMAIRTDSQGKVRALLNDDQKTKFDALEARMRGRMGRHGGPGGPDGPGGPPPPPPAGV